MKDLIKSKSMIVVAILIIATAYISATKNASADDTDNKVISQLNYEESISQK